MGDAFIVRRGGIADAFAVIAVAYPEGSACTCTKGSKTLRAKDISGSFLFLIPEAGTWTVSCTDGTRTKSQNVSIMTLYQAVNIVLNYVETLLPYSGTSPWTGRKTHSNTAYNNFTIGPTYIEVYAGGEICSAMVLTSNPKSLGTSSMISVNVSSFSKYNNTTKGYIVISSTSTPSKPSDCAAFAEISSTGVKTLSSNLTGDYYIGIMANTSAESSSYQNRIQFRIDQFNLT